MQAPDAEEKPVAAENTPQKRKIKTKTNDKAKGTAANGNLMVDLPGADVDDTSKWTKAQDDQIIKFKADDPQGKWEDLATTMTMAGKGGDLKGRFAELKKDGKIEGGAGGAGEKKDEPKKSEGKKGDEKNYNDKKDGNNEGGDGNGKKGKKVGDGGGINDAKAIPDAKADVGKAYSAKGGKGQFTEAEMVILREAYAMSESERFGWTASRFFDQTGKTVHPDKIKAALGVK